MSISAISPLSAMTQPVSPLIIEAFRLAPIRAAEQTVQSEALKAEVLKQRAIQDAQEERLPPSAPEDIPQWPRPGISTRQIISLTRRYQLQSLSYEQLYNIPDSQLNPEEKAFIKYLRFNKTAFSWFSALDGEPGSLSPQDIQKAATLIKNPDVILPEDLKILSELARTQAIGEAKSDAKAFQLLKTSDLIASLRQLSPQPMSAAQVLSLNPDQTGLAGKALASLHFLQWPPVARLLPQVTQPYAGNLTPDALRVLMAIIFNPLIYSYMPRMRFPSSALTTASVYPVTAIDELGGLSGIQPDREALRADAGDTFDPMLKLEAHEVLLICHQLNPDGHVSLQQLRDYHPDSVEHAKIANLLRQTMIFEALAGLDQNDDTLSEADMARALSQGAIILPDHHRLVILP